MSSVFGNIVDGLKKLMQALQAIEPAPNETTVYFNDAVFCANPNLPSINGTFASDVIELENNGELLSINSLEVEYTPNGGPPVLATWHDIINVAGGGPPNLQDVLDNGNSASNQSILLTDSTTTNNCNLNATNISFADPTTPYITVVNAYGMSYNPNPWSGVTTYAAAGLTMSGADYNTNFTVSGTSIERPSTTSMTYYIDSKIEMVNFPARFEFNLAGQFVKWNTGTSYKCDFNDQNVYRDYSFKASDNGADFIFDVYTYYLDNSMNPGFTIVLSNQAGGDINCITPDIYFYSHGTAFTGSSFPLKKYATARFTLTICPSQPFGYAWAVSMY